MADAIIGATIQVLLEKAISLATDRIGSVFGLKKELEALQESAATIQAVLADAEIKYDKSQLVQRWLEKVVSVAFEINHVLDELNYEILRRKVRSRNQQKVCLFFSSCKHDISFRWRIGYKVRDANCKLKNFNLEATEIGLIRMAASLLPTASITVAAVESAKSRETNSRVVPQYVVGRAKEESEIVNLLLGSSNQNIYVLPIVGMGGIGKTTLVKSVYNNQHIESHFSKRIWIRVSENFEVTELFRAILESLKEEKVEISSQDAIVKEVGKDLHGQRFLLVLDDVWNENPKLWDDFFLSLVALCTIPGSCCLLTTRLKTTANLGGSRGVYTLNKLSDEDCWSIIKQKATAGGEMPEELNKHKAQILSRCHGLPLAANAIGGLLCLQRKEDWLSIVNDKVLKPSRDLEDDISRILKLSFDYLPSPSIKKCFAYCSVFAKDTIIERDELIELWVAEGFLQEKSESGTTMEEMGGNYLRILLQSSLLEVKGDRYQMHSLVHDLAMLVSKTKSSKMEKNNQVRHLSLNSCGEETEKVLNAMSSPFIRKIVVNSSISDEMLLKFKFIHVLNLSGGVIIKELPRCIRKLKHLRYLNLSRSKIQELPETLCKLYNLQTLRLNGCFHLQSLPRRLNNLIGLRHLHYFDFYERLQMPPEMGRLTCLQTLKFFNVGEEKGCGIDELGHMEQLKGELHIRNLELVKGKEEARLANLFCKPNLMTLGLYWTSADRYGIENCDKHVLEGLEPHSNLQELRIDDFMGDQFPQWIGNLSLLVKLEFYNCKRCTELPGFGHLPRLENLTIWGLESLSCIGDSFYQPYGGGRVASMSRRKLFPALKTLALIQLSHLTEWKEVKPVDCDGDDVGVLFPRLESLCINACPQLRNTPTHFPTLNKLEILGDLRFSVVQNILRSSAGALKSFSIRSMDELTCFSDLIALQEHNSVISHNHLASLEYLEIEGCNGLINIPSETLEGCTSLTSILITNCSNLISFPVDLQRLSSLSSMLFKDCPQLFSRNGNMPGGFDHLTNLKELSVGPFSDDSVELFDWAGLASCSSTLSKLHLYGMPQMQKALPDQLQHLTSLTYLVLASYGSLEALPDWLGNLASLETLELWDFPKLRCLPSMDAMARLTKFRVLVLYGCPILKERCNGEINGSSDSEWSKISQLPNLGINILQVI
ncbi:OLC1v1000410C1 [Oldenlandia corymbosa var. corymbosa]|uniref:OLC1v1000410C1 n=1 Tax=Oldenlandia corymbosa var. corymbosa TaxID=529605 RepID=A0AAV1D2W4_OLDCO|nr:OLC1v1000410C1 [Oldenlandia corymbosa var. corymbosa]